MATAEITKVAVPHTNAGVNLTDAAFTTLVAGAGNGVKFLWESDLLLYLRNDSGGSLTFTLKLAPGSEYTAYGATITSPTIVIANGKTYLVRLNQVFKSSDSYAYVECSGAGKALVLDP